MGLFILKKSQKDKAGDPQETINLSRAKIYSVDSDIDGDSLWGVHM